MSDDFPSACSTPEEYEVGYGKPPAQYQFKKGNKFSKGKPKGSKAFKTIVTQALGIKVPAKINGKTVKMTKAELAIHQLANKASAGDLKAIEKVIALQQQYGPPDDPAGPSPEQLKMDADALKEMLELYELFNEADGDG
jgi:hypothetical protein